MDILYADARDIIEDVVEAKVAQSVVALLEQKGEDGRLRVPGVPLYLGGTLAQLRAGAWYSVPRALQIDAGHILRDAVLVALRNGLFPMDGDVPRPLSHVLAANDGTTYYARYCEKADGSGDAFACNLAIAANQLAFGSEGVESAIRSAAVLAFTTAVVEELDPRLVRVLKAWAGNVAARDDFRSLLSSDAIRALEGTTSKISCGDSPLMDLVNGAPDGWDRLRACAAGEYAGSIPEMAIGGVKKSLVDLAKSSSATDAADVGKWWSHIVPSPGAKGTVFVEFDGKKCQVEFGDSGAIVSNTCAAEWPGIGQLGHLELDKAAMSKALERVKKALGLEFASVEHVRWLARGAYLLSALDDKLALLREPGTNSIEPLGALSSILQLVAEECKTNSGACKALVNARNLFGQGKERLATLYAVMRGLGARDIRPLLVDVLSTALPNEPLYRAFLVDFAMYLLGRDGTNAQAARDAFRGSTKRLLGSIGGTGLPAPGTTNLGLGLLHPVLTLRASVSKAFEIDGEMGARTSVGVQLLNFRVGFSRYAALQISAIDLLGPLGELSANSAHQASDRSMAWYLLVRPEAALLFGAPTITSNLAASIGIAFRTVHIERLADGSTSARYVAGFTPEYFASAMVLF